MGSSRRWKRAKQLDHSRGRAGDGEFKMSAALMDFAKPLLDSFELPRDEDAFVGAVKVSAALWNAMMDPPAGGLASICAELASTYGSAPTRELADVFGLMLACGRAKYSHVCVQIADVDVEVHADGRCTVRVLTSL